MIVYRLHHNGSVINFLNSLEEVAAAIKEVIDKHQSLNPEKIMNVQQGNKTVVIYQYWTKYLEMFMIEEIAIGD